MHINILQKKIKEGLSVTGRAVAKASTLPILKNIYFKTDGNYLCLTATDLEIAVKWWSLVNKEKEGEFLVNYETINSFINTLPNEKISFKSSDKNVQIVCGDYKTQINSIDHTDYPVVPEIKEKQKITLASNTLCAALINTVDIPSDSKIKPEISGVLFNYKDGEFSFVATDTYRLAEKKISVSEKLSDFSVIIPQRTVREVINIFKEVPSDVDILFSDNQVVFRAYLEDSEKPFIELTSKIIEGNYPDYKKIIPQQTTSQITVKREDFLNKIKAASVFSTKVREVNFNVSPKNKVINITSNNTDIGHYESTIKGEGEGDDIEVSFNYRFLIDGLSNITSSEVVLEISEDNKPGLLKPVGKDDYLYVIMPIKK